MLSLSSPFFYAVNFVLDIFVFERISQLNCEPLLESCELGLTKLRSEIGKKIGVTKHLQKNVLGFSDL